MQTETARLKDGYRRDVEKSGLQKAAKEIKSFLSKPEWLKSRNWMV